MKRQNQNAPSYRLEGVSQDYAGKTVLKIDSLSIERQSITGIVGPNGSGKSTLLRILAFLEEPVRGRVLFDGHPHSAAQGRAGGKVTMVPQEPYLLKRSVENNVAYGLKVRGVKDWNNRVKEVLNRVGLSPERFSRRPWYELSGGEAQRVALAARLVLRPRVLLLDEPTTSLDAESAERIKTAVRAAKKEWKTTLVVVSHDTKWLDTVCDQILFMAYGELEAVR